MAVKTTQYNENVKFNGVFTLNNGTQAAGYVLTSDSGGTATWQASTGGSGATNASFAVTTGLTSGVTVSIQHGLNTLDVLVQIKDLTSNELIGVTVDNYQLNSVEVTANLTIPSARVIVLSAGGTGSTGSSSADVYVTGGTYSNSTGTATFRNNSGTTFSVTGFTTGANNWALTGNSGTVDNSTNIIGTTDINQLNIIVGNKKSGRIDATLLTTAFGYQTLSANTIGNNNTAFGYGTLSGNITGNSNTAIGSLALNVNNTFNNTAIGAFSLVSNTFGTNNTGVGTSTMYPNTTGSKNSAVGVFSLGNNTIGNNNSSVGYGALQNNSSGSENTAIGTEALKAITTVSSTSALGYRALSANTSGTNNTAVGFESLSTNIVGGNNTGTGIQTLKNNTASNNTGLGAFALVTNTTGASNLGVGTSALFNNSTGSFNTAVGVFANGNSSTGSTNTSLGFNALVTNTDSGNVAIGHKAGYYETAANTLYIHNGLGVTDLASGKSNSIIYGVMNATATSQTLKFNAKVSIVDGTQANGRILVSDANGAGTWTSATAATGSDNSEWTQVAFASGDFTAAPGTWALTSPDLTQFRYKVIGKTMFLTLTVGASTTTSTPNALFVKIPGGYSAKVSDQWNFGVYANGSAWETLFITTAAADTNLGLFRGGGTLFPNGTNNQSVRFTIAFEIA